MKIRKIVEGDPPSDNNPEIAYNFFVKEKGYSPEVALGIVGNLMKESYTDLRVNALGDNNTAYGIAQWRGNRLSNLKKVRPDDYNTLRGQLEFIDWELNNTEKKAGTRLKKADTVEDATLAFSQHYERPHKDYADNDTRIRHAVDLGSKVGAQITPTKKVKEILTNQETKASAPTKQESVNIPPLATAPINPNYTVLPEIETEKQEDKKEKPITEAQIRKLLEEERKNTEKRFLTAFKQQNNRQQTDYEPQPQEEDLSYLYNYIDIDNYADGGEKGCGGEGEPPCDSEELKAIMDASVKIREDNETPSSVKQGMYLDEQSKYYKQLKKKEKYFSPPKLENISTGDWQQDLLYRNDWLMDIPIIGDKIKEKAFNIAELSGSKSSLDSKELERVKRGVEATGLKNSKKYTGNYGDLDNEKRVNILEQYFKNNQNLPSSMYKPKSDYLEFLPSYSLKQNFEKDYKNNTEAYSPEYEDMKESFKVAIDKVIGNYDNFIKDKQPIYKNESSGTINNLLLGSIDLGGHKEGAAWDEDLDLPYISVSDAWDFEPYGYSDKWARGKDNKLDKKGERSFIQSYLMHKAGKPFKIYDRFYFDPKTKEYISDEDIKKLKKKK